MQSEKLEEIKNEVQKILDNHLKGKNRILINNFDEESIYDLIELLLAKNDKKWKQVRTKIEKKINTEKMHIDKNYQKLINIIDKLNIIRNENYNIKFLKNEINLDEDLKKKLENI